MTNTAITFAKEVLAFAESIGDKLQIATALDGLAGPLTKLGQLPQALELRERREAINRSQGNHASLAFDLTLRAELLVRLGRGPEAEEALREVERKAKEGVGAYMVRRTRVAMLRALRAATEDRHADTLAFAQLAQEPGKSDGTTRFAKALQEYAMASTSRPPKTSEAPVPSAASANAREISYWLARASLTRADYQRAYDTAKAAWSAPGARGDNELAWRMKAVGAAAASHLTSIAELRATIASESDEQREQLASAWGEAARAYFSRPDLLSLRKRKT